MRPNVDSSAGRQMGRAHLVEEYERANGGMFLVRQGAMHLETTEVMADRTQGEKKRIVHRTPLFAWCLRLDRKGMDLIAQKI